MRVPKQLVKASAIWQQLAKDILRRTVWLVPKYDKAMAHCFRDMSWGDEDFGVTRYAITSLCGLDRVKHWADRYEETTASHPYVCQKCLIRAATIRLKGE